MPSTSKDITFEDLSKYFHLPINQVAKELGICATILKKICRKNGIPRWPHRKIKSLDKRLQYLEENAKKEPAAAPPTSDVEAEISHLKRKKAEIMRNPSLLVKNPPSNTFSLKPTGIMKPTQQHNIPQTMINSAPSKSLTGAEMVLLQTSPNTNYPMVSNQMPMMMPPTRFMGPQSPLKILSQQQPQMSMPQPTLMQIVPPTSSPNDHLFFDFVLRQQQQQQPGISFQGGAPPPTFPNNSSSPSSQPSFSMPQRQQQQQQQRAQTTTTTSSDQLPSFRVLFDVVETERVRLEQESQLPPRPQPQINSSLQTPSPFPDWYFEEKNRVLGRNPHNS